MSQSHPPPEALAALGKVVSGVFVVTARRGGSETGMLGSWVQQCSFDPPQITMAVARDRPILEWLTEDAPFTVNILAEGEKQLLKHFSRGFGLGEPAFDGLEIEHRGKGGPVLAAALAYLECRVAGRVPVGDHDLIIGRVVGGGILHEGRPKTHVRNSGAHY